MMIKLALISTKNVLRHWRQSMAAILSISACFVALVVFQGYVEETRRIMYVENRHRMMYADVIVENENLWQPDGRFEPWKYQLEAKEQKFINDYLSSNTQVETWASFLRLGGMITNGTVRLVFSGLGIDIPNAKKIRGAGWYNNTLYGVPLDESPPESMLLGYTLAKSLDCEPSPERKILRKKTGYEDGERKFQCKDSNMQLTSVSPTGTINAMNFDVTGLVDSGYKGIDSKFLLVPLEQAQELTGQKHVSYYSILLKDPAESRKIAVQMTDKAHEQGLNLKAVDWRDHRNIGSIYFKTASLLNTFNNFVIAIIFGISILSVLNTLIKMVVQRSREIGTWRCLGYSRRQVLFIFSIEAVGIGILGSAIGAVLSIILSLVVSSSGIFYRAGLFVQPVPLSIAVIPTDYVKSLVILITVCLISSLIAARSIVNRKICDNLIHS